MEAPSGGRQAILGRAAWALALLAGLGAVAGVRAEDAGAALPSNYVAGFVGTTLGYRPHGGSWEGWQHDAATTIGYGRQVRPTVALELDLGPTFVRGSYSSFSLVPGVVWSVHPNLYLAGRLAIPVDPETNLVLLPGVGLSRAFGRVMPTLELSLSSAVGRGEPDLGVSLTAGLLVFF